MTSADNSTIFFLMIVLAPIMGFLIHFFFLKAKPIAGSLAATAGIWIGLIAVLIAWMIGIPFVEKNEAWGFIANEISWLMATLILFVSAVVHTFSRCYMAGDRHYRRFFLLLNLVTISTLLMVAADNVIYLMFFWTLSNLMLVLLMIHKSEWSAAKNSGWLALKTFAIGLLFLVMGISLMAFESGTLSLHDIAENSANLTDLIRFLALCCVIIAAFSQSGCWPFHRWLISSLNSPTPVSALMHAGLVNGGGLLLTRLAPIFLHDGLLLDAVFVFALVTLVMGGTMKLLQSDYKRMLACSTMTQMGFMMMQCGLGLFPAALAHLCWHGLFKAFLFLKSGSVISEHRQSVDEDSPNFSLLMLSLFIGIIGAAGFAYGSGLAFDLTDTGSVLIFFSWVALSQLIYSLLQKKHSFLFVLSACALCLGVGIVYGLTVDLIEQAVVPLQISQAQMLNPIHYLAISFIFFIWIVLTIAPFINYKDTNLWRRLYVRMLNAGQPHRSTVTSGRTGYKF